MGGISSLRPHRTATTGCTYDLETGERRLPTDQAFGYVPAWSPDGRQIAFSSNHEALHLQLYAINADGSLAARDDQHGRRHESGMDPESDRETPREVSRSCEGGSSDCYAVGLVTVPNAPFSTGDFGHAGAASISPISHPTSASLIHVLLILSIRKTLVLLLLISLL